MKVSNHQLMVMLEATRYLATVNISGGGGPSLSNADFHRVYEEILNQQDREPLEMDPDAVTRKLMAEQDGMLRGQPVKSEPPTLNQQSAEGNAGNDT